jgi:thiamine-monophosphate kinase
MMKLEELGEFGLIGRIADRVTPSAGIRIGIGDDAAAVETVPGTVSLFTTDMLLEGVHFDLTFCTPENLGWKSLAVNLSDIAAMGGKPRYCLLSLAVPQSIPVSFIDGFVAGLLDCAEEFEVTLIGGDTCASRGGLVVSLTVMGEQLPERVVPRSGARPGDLILVTGTIGDSALGLRQLMAGQREGSAIHRHLEPSPRVREGLKLAEEKLPTAMIDISDGLLADLGHILKRSGVGARLELAHLPLSPEVAAHISRQDDNPFNLPLSGGEDYELLFTIPPDREGAVRNALSPFGTSASMIGTITPSGLSVVDRNGKEYPVVTGGYNHFSPVH